MDAGTTPCGSLAVPQVRSARRRGIIRVLALAPAAQSQPQAPTPHERNGAIECRETEAVASNNHSTLMFADRMTLPHLSASSATKLLNSAGECRGD
jgi:hypothetical protein